MHAKTAKVCLLKAYIMFFCLNLYYIQVSKSGPFSLSIYTSTSARQFTTLHASYITLIKEKKQIYVSVCATTAYLHQGANDT